MADFKGNPFIILAADVAAAPVVVGPAGKATNFHVLQIEFGGGTDGDVAQVNRGDGADFWVGKAPSNVRSGTLGWTGPKGLVIPQGGIPHGEIKIHHR